MHERVASPRAHAQAALAELPQGELVAILRYICQCTPAAMGLGLPADRLLTDAATSSDEARARAPA